MNLLLFAQTYKADALATQTRYGVSAAMVLAVAAWESQWGESTNVAMGNNYFGLKSGTKASPFGLGKRKAPDGGYYVTYASARASFLDFGRLLTEHYPTVARLSNDPVAFAHAFMGSGYMTDPNRYFSYSPFIIDKARLFLPIVKATTGLAIGGLVAAGVCLYLTKKYFL